jgi:hypothetical protein
MSVSDTHEPVCSVAATIRHNVDLRSDVSLALREFKALTGQSEVRLLENWADCERTPVGELPLPIQARIRSTARQASPVGFATTAPAPTLNRIVQKAAFLQDVAGATSEAWRTDAKSVHAHGSHVFSGVPITTLAEYASRLTDSPREDMADRLDALLAFLLEGRVGRYAREIETAIASKKTTLALTHDLHIYKAKFFPRMVHALMNIFEDDFRVGTVVDPFSGSGTALLEASILGLPSVGTDVDPLSALISRCKVEPFTKQRRETRKLLSAVLMALDLPVLSLRSPSELSSPLSQELRAKLRRLDSKLGKSYLQEIERDIATLQEIRRTFQRSRPGVLEVLLSDAVTKKIRYRFVGVGNGRYTIEVVAQPILERFRNKVASTLALCDVFEWFEQRLGVCFARSSAKRGDATALTGVPMAIRVGACITSPPYLPASSGREHYASSRALALTMTGLSDSFDMGKFVGVAENRDIQQFDPDRLTPAGQKLIEYLRSDSDRTDPQRDAMRFERKAIPTWRYLLDIEDCLKALHGRMMRGGLCLMIVASKHVFYSHRRLQEAKRAGGEADAVEYVAIGKELYGELASRSGWSLEEEITMELAKSQTSMARPRSKDEYSESILILRS